MQGTLFPKGDVFVNPPPQPSNDSGTLIAQNVPRISTELVDYVLAIFIALYPSVLSTAMASVQVLGRMHTVSFQNLQTTLEISLCFFDLNRFCETRNSDTTPQDAECVYTFMSGVDPVIASYLLSSRWV